LKRTKFCPNNENGAKEIANKSDKSPEESKSEPQMPAAEIKQVLKTP